MIKKFIVSNIDEFNTSEGYFGDSFIRDEFITIPYFNIGLMEDHPINVHKQQLFIDFCFIQIINPKYLSVFQSGVLINKLKTYDFKKSTFLGGTFIGDHSEINSEIEIQASDIFLILPKEYCSSLNIWIPAYKKFKEKGNIPEKKVVSFLSQTSKINKIQVRFNK